MANRAGPLSPGKLELLLGDLVLGVAALYLAFLIRIGFPIPGSLGLLPAERGHRRLVLAFRAVHPGR